MPKPKLEKASPRIPELAKKAGGIFVFATADASLPAKANVSAVLSEYRYANHSCKKCKSQVAMPKLKDGSPFCVICGHDEVVAGGDLKMSIPPDNKLSYLTCAGCGVLNTFPLSLTTAGHGVHCTACGHQMHKATADLDGVPSSTDDLENDIPSVDDLSLMDLDDETDDIDLDETVAETDDDDKEDKEEDKEADAALTVAAEGDDDEKKDDDADDKEADAALTVAAEGDDAKDDDDKEDKPAEASPEDNFGGKKAAPFGKDDAKKDEGDDKEADANVDDSSDDGKKDDEDKAEAAPDEKSDLTPMNTPEPNNDAPEMPGGEYVALDLVDMGETAAVSGVTFFYSNGKVLLSANDQIVATLVDDDAKAFKGMLQTQQFQMSVAHAIEKKGLKEAIVAHGFKIKQVKVPLTKVVKAKVEASLAKRKAEVAVTAKNYGVHFQQCVDIAAAGYAGNHWRNRQDPVKAALVAELNGLGIKKAEKIIDKVFASYSVKQFRDILEIARSLEQKPVEVLNSLADNIDLVKYKPFEMASKTIENAGADDEDDEDDGDDDTSVEFSTATPVSHVETSAPVGSRYRSPELARILGDRPVFSV